MKPIFGPILLATLLTLAPATAWSQYPTFNFSRDSGAATTIDGSILPDASCPPAVYYNARYSGGDGVPATMDANPINTGGRTAMSYALADANGSARAFTAADSSAPCGSPTGSTFMSATGTATAVFYKRYSVGYVPTSPRFDLRWGLQGSFSHVTSNAWGGHASLRIFLLLAPPPPGSWPGTGGFTLAAADLYATGLLSNQIHCFGQGCKPLPNAAVLDSGGIIDVLAAFQTATGGRALAAGDSFIIVGILQVSAQACGFQPGCPVPTFTTDFSTFTKVRSDVELIP